MADRLFRRAFQKTPDPVQRSKTAPPRQSGERRPSRDIPERRFLEKPRVVSPTPPPKKTVLVPLTTTTEFRSSGEKRKQPQPPAGGPPPLPTSPRPHMPTNPAITSLQSESDRRRPDSLPATARNEGFQYPGSDSARRRPSLRAQPLRYGDELQVFNNGIGGGPIQRYPLVDDRYRPLTPGPPASSSRAYNSAPGTQQQQPPKRPGRPEQYSRNM